jgi:hypothetical protein
VDFGGLCRGRRGSGRGTAATTISEPEPLKLFSDITEIPPYACDPFYKFNKIPLIRPKPLFDLEAVTFKAVPIEIPIPRD